jgi:uncharacterized protein (DUF983 family)
MKVSRSQILFRGLAHRCPNCGRRTIFAPLPDWFTVNKTCAVCGLVFERSEGFFLGAMVISYTFAGAALVPVLLLVAMGRLDVLPAVVFLAAWCVVFPLGFFRAGKSLWLMTYDFTVPGDLPANGGDAAEVR